MTSPSPDHATDPAADHATDDRSRFGFGGLGRRRRPAPPAHPFFRFVFPVLLGVAGVLVFILWRDGAKAVLDTTDGAEVFAVDDPTEPGFLAFATPTPTLLVAHVDDGGSLIGVSVLARTSLDDGGNVVIFSPDMLLDLDGDDDPILHDLFAREGADGLERAIGEWMGFGFTEAEPMIMEPERLLAFLELVEPLPYFLPDPLVRVADAGAVEEVYPAGNGAFSGAELAEIYAWQNPSESDASRFTRQAAVWEAWLTRVGEADDLAAATLPFTTGLPPYLRAFGTGAVVVEVVPAVAYDFGTGRPLYALAEGMESWPVEKGREMVPLPVAYAPGAWPTVQLLDGTGDPLNRSRYLPKVAAAGAEITVIGNALAFGVEETSVTYHSVDAAPRAEALAETLGVPVRFDEDLDQPAELTVTVGLDSADL